MAVDVSDVPCQGAFVVCLQHNFNELEYTITEVHNLQLIHSFVQIRDGVGLSALINALSLYHVRMVFIL